MSNFQYVFYWISVGLLFSLAFIFEIFIYYGVDKIRESTDTSYILSYISKKPGIPNLLGFFDILDNLFLNFNMAWKITPINMDMIDDGYSDAEAKVYSRLRRLSRHTDNADILYPSQAQIAKDLRISEKWVRNALNILERD